jgi:hypothetical protein
MNLIAHVSCVVILSALGTSAENSWTEWVFRVKMPPSGRGHGQPDTRFKFRSMPQHPGNASVCSVEIEPWESTTTITIPKIAVFYIDAAGDRESLSVTATDVAVGPDQANARFTVGDSRGCTLVGTIHTFDER